MRGSTLSMILLVSALTGCELIGSDEANRNGTCGQHSSCPFDQACGGGNCVDLLNRSFVVSQVDVELCDLDLNGVAFDSGDGSSPDPQVEVRFSGQTIFSSPVEINALMATYPIDNAEVTISDFSDSFEVEVRDDDDGTAQLMDTLAVDVNYPGLRAGEVVVVNEADCSESPVTRVGLLLRPVDGAW